MPSPSILPEFASRGVMKDALRPTDPRDIDHPALREFALHAAWVAKLEETVDVLEDLVADLRDDVADDDADGALEVLLEDPLDVALSIVSNDYEEADQALEGEVIAWLAEDPEHWPIFRLVLLDPWQVRPGRWRADTPRWVRSLATDVVLAHFQQDRYGRQRTIHLLEEGDT
jgi:hypothetical protein